MADGFVRQLAIGLSWDINNDGLIETDSAVDGIVDRADEGADAMDGLSSAGEETGRGLSRAFDGFKGVLVGGLDLLEDMKFKLAAVGAAGAAAISRSVRMAGDMEERLNTLAREFGRSADAVTGWAREYSRATELTEMQIIDWSATLGINLRMLDLTSDEMAGVTREMIELTHNFAHFTDMDPEQAFNAIHMAIRGGRFPRALRDITGAISRTDIETRALNEGLIQQGEEMNQQIERIATLSLLQEQLAITQGAAADGQEEMNTRFARFRGVLGDITRDVGHIFLPTFSRGLGLINDFLDTMRESRLARISAGILGIVTVTALLGAGLGGLVTIGKKLSAGLGVIAGAVGIAKLPLLGLTALVGGLVFIIEDLWVGFQGGESAVFNLVRWLGDALGITDELREGFEGFKDGIGDIWSSLNQFASGINSIFSGLGKTIWGFLTFDPDMMLEGLSELAEGISDTIIGLDQTIQSIGWGIFRGVRWILKTTVTGLWNLSSGLVENMFNSLMWSIETGWNTIAEKIEEWTGIELPRIELPRWPDVIGFVGDKWDEFKGWLSALNPVQALRDAFEDFGEWLPEFPRIELGLDTWWGGIAEFFVNISPLGLLIRAFAGFAGWRPDLPDISFSLSDMVDAINDFSPVQWLRDSFTGFTDWRPQFPDLKGAISDWWEGVGSWVDENLSFSGLLVGGWFGRGEEEKDDIDVEPVSGGQRIEHQSNPVNNDIKNDIKIYITESEDPEQTARIVEKKLRQFFEQELVGAGG